MSKTKTYHVTPEYFHDQSETLVFASAALMASFLNYTKDPCTVKTVG